MTMKSAISRHLCDPVGIDWDEVTRLDSDSATWDQLSEESASVAHAEVGDISSLFWQHVLPRKPRPICGAALSLRQGGRRYRVLLEARFIGPGGMRRISCLQQRTSYGPHYCRSGCECRVCT